MRNLLRGLMFSIACFSASAASAEVRAIIAGFNDYPDHPLKGGVADAQDIASALKKRGVSDLTILTNGTETVDHFKKEWAASVARAKAGDWIILSFAGHGIRDREKEGSHMSRDGFDKGFIFPAYFPSQNPENLLRDEILYDMFKAASAKGIKVLFVADACHAGTGIRGAGALGAVRGQLLPERGPVRAAPKPAQNLPPRPPIASVAVLSGQTQDKSINEVIIDGQARGALSYAVARGIEGAADPNKAGNISVDGLWRYVRRIVQTQSENAQEPVIYAREEDGNLRIFEAPQSHTAGGKVPETTSGRELPPLPDIALFSYMRLAGIEGAKFVDTPAQANLIWDAARGVVSNPSGDHIAFDIDTGHLQGAIDARRMLIFLQRLAAEHGALETKLHLADAPAGSSNNSNYGNGEKVQFEVELGTMPYLLVFDLNADGTVQYLYPLKKDPDQISPVPTLINNIVVKKPFGGDFVVFIRSDRPLSKLRDLLYGEKDSVQVRDVNDTLRHALSGRNFQIGIQGLFTCEKLTADRQCVDTLSSSH